MKLLHGTAVLVALLVTLQSAHAQSPARPKAQGATKSLGGDKPSGRRLTRDELRACLDTQERLARRRAEVERERAEVDREKAALQGAGAGLTSEREQVERRRDEAVSAFNARNEALKERIAAFERRVAAFAELQEKRAPRDEIDRERAELERERGELTAAEEALRSEAEAVKRTSGEAASGFNARSTEHDRKVDAFNARSRALAERAQGWQKDSEQWKAACAGRPYLEDDEIAIKAGK